MTFDPEKWLLAKATVQVISEMAPALKAEPFLVPNPFYDSIYIPAPEGKIILRFFDSGGKEVLQREMEGHQGMSVNTQSLPPGPYQIRWESGGKSGMVRALKGQR
jgi:hypothetical protein